MSVIKALLKSRKAVMTFTGLLVLGFTHFGFDEAMATKAAELIMLYVAAQGVNDAARDFKYASRS